MPSDSDDGVLDGSDITTSGTDESTTAEPAPAPSVPAAPQAPALTEPVPDVASTPEAEPTSPSQPTGEPFPEPVVSATVPAAAAATVTAAAMAAPATATSAAGSDPRTGSDSDAEPDPHTEPDPLPHPHPEPSADEPDPASVPTAAEPTADKPVAETPTGGRRALLPVVAAATAVALLAGGAGALGWQLRQQAQAETAREDGLNAARDAARLLFSYDHQTLAEDFEAGLAVTTGDFREEYSRTTQEVVTPVAEEYDAVVAAEVIEAAVVAASGDEVVALVFLNQATTSTRVQGQQVDQSRVRMRLVPRDGQWLVEKVDAL